MHQLCFSHGFSSFFFKRLANRLGANGPDYLTLDQLVSQQLLGSILARPSGGCRRTPSLSTANFTFAVQSLLTPTQLLFAIQRRLDPLLHTALAYSLDR